MNRETELRYSEVPQIHKPRSKFKVEFSHLTSFDAADCVPIFCEEVLPGDSIRLDMSAVVRMSTPLFPTMSNAVMDCFFFFVPDRLLWTHWKEFWGENTNAWYQTIDYSVPQLKTSDMYKFEPKTVADYLGLPSDIPNLSVNVLPFRAYVKIWNDWFRDENLQQEAPMVTTDADAYYDSTYAYLGGALLKANKLHDRFTSSLPSPQKGPSTTIPLGSVAPVYATSENIPNKTTFGTATLDTLKWRTIGTNLLDGEKLYGLAGQTISGGTSMTKTLAGEELTADDINGTQLSPRNLWTDLSNATASTISDLRLAFQIQRYYEALSRSGSRYIEWLKAVFNVTSPDARLQRSEYLGGRRIPIEMYQTVQQSSTTETSPLGQTGAFSHTADKTHYFTKSFTEHGIIIGIATVRYYHIYQQGVPRMFLRKKWYDYYIPQFANLSEQPVYVKEIYAQGTANDDAVFGYQEAWSEYRMRTNMTSSAMKSTYSGSLDAWHYGDYYESQPSLSASWIAEDKTVIDRTLALSSTVENQFIGDFYFKGEYVRQMPLYSVPGLIDHL